MTQTEIQAQLDQARTMMRAAEAQTAQGKLIEASESLSLAQNSIATVHRAIHPVQPPWGNEAA